MVCTDMCDFEFGWEKPCAWLFCSGRRYGLDGWIPPMDGPRLLEIIMACREKGAPGYGAAFHLLIKLLALEVVHTYPLSTLAVLHWLSYYYRWKFKCPCSNREVGAILVTGVRDASSFRPSFHRSVIYYGLALTRVACTN